MTPILACIPVGSPGYQPRPGSIVVACDCCGVQGWIGPRQQAVREKCKAPVLCPACCVKMNPVAAANIKHLGG